MTRADPPPRLAGLLIGSLNVPAGSNATCCEAFTTRPVCAPPPVRFEITVINVSDGASGLA